MKTIVIIQARMGSSRLPGKILMPLANVDVLTYVVERSKNIKGINEVVVATSCLQQDDVVENWCIANSVDCFRGSETDVLDRYVKAAKKYKPDFVIRVTADCPFLDYKLASEMVKKIEGANTDFIRIEGDLPRGLAVEVFSFQTLQYNHEHGNEARHREHVTYYAYENKEEFTWSIVETNKNLQHPELRITLDTEEDYQLCKRIADHFKNDLLVPSKDVVKYLLDNPEIAKINAHIEQKPVV